MAHPARRTHISAWPDNYESQRQKVILELDPDNPVSNYCSNASHEVPTNALNIAGQRVEVRVGEQNPLTTSATVNSVCSAYTMVVGDPSSRHQCDRTSQARYVSVIAPDGGPLHVCAISLIVENPQGGRAPAPGETQSPPKLFPRTINCRPKHQVSRHLAVMARGTPSCTCSYVLLLSTWYF